MASDKELELAQETLETLRSINEALIQITKDNLNEKNTRNVEKYRLSICKIICITIAIIFLLFFIFYKQDTIVIENPKTRTTETQGGIDNE